MTPPKTPELKQSDSCNTSDVENNLTYRNVYLTVPGQMPIADYSDTDQVSFFCLFKYIFSLFFCFVN